MGLERECFHRPQKARDGEDREGQTRGFGKAEQARPKAERPSQDEADCNREGAGRDPRETSRPPRGSEPWKAHGTRSHSYRESVVS